MKVLLGICLLLICLIVALVAYFIGKDLDRQANELWNK